MFIHVLVMWNLMKFKIGEVIHEINWKYFKLVKFFLVRFRGLSEIPDPVVVRLASLLSTLGRTVSGTEGRNMVCVALQEYYDVSGDNG